MDFEKSLAQIGAIETIVIGYPSFFAALTVLADLHHFVFFSSFILFLFSKLLYLHLRLYVHILGLAIENKSSICVMERRSSK